MAVCGLVSARSWLPLDRLADESNRDAEEVTGSTQSVEPAGPNMPDLASVSEAVPPAIASHRHGSDDANRAISRPGRISLVEAGDQVLEVGVRIEAHRSRSTLRISVRLGTSTDHGRHS